MSSAGRRVLLAVAAIFAVSLFVATGLAQVSKDPRNDADEYFDAVNGAKCYAHHGGEGFQPMDIRLVERYSQLPMGEEVPLTMRVEHNSRIGQTVQAMSVVVDTSNAPNVEVVHEDMVEDLEETKVVTVPANAAPMSESFEVMDGASEIFVGARVVGEPFGQAVGMPQGQITMTGTTPAERSARVEGSDFSQFIRLSGEQVVNAGTGSFTVGVAWETDMESVDPEMDVEITMMVNYTQEETEFIFRAPSDERLRSRGDRYDFVIPIRVTGEDPGVIDFRVQSVSYWDHSPSDAAPRDDGLYYRFTTMRVAGGDQLVRLDSAAAPTPAAPAVELYNLFARILGFTAAMLIPVAMLTGGIFGKGSRRWLNKVTGGAKKRVLWHSAMSWMILAVASFHFVLALVEAKFIWTKGLLWGGAGWALLVSLGFTGYYQVRMIKRWNYKVWRHTHLWSAVAVLGFALIHMTVDGSDFKVIRDALPGWVERLSWP